MEKVSKINIHLQALFAAIESGQDEKARAILDTADLDLNNCNSEGLTILDVAVLLGNVKLSRILMSFGAKEGAQHASKERITDHLNQLLNDAECRLDQLANRADSAKTEQDKSVALWKRKLRLLRKMRAGIELLRLPQNPNQVRLEVTGENSAVIWWTQTKFDDQSDTVTTKVKVEWSCSPDFSTIGGGVDFRDLGSSGEVKIPIEGLPANQRCYFRIAAGNLAGLGAFKPTSPPCVLLSAWRSVDGRKARFEGRLPLLDDLFHQLGELRDVDEGSAETPAKQRRNQSKMSLRQLFGTTVKLHKNLRRGIYLACILFHQDKILVTNEEFPPVVEVDDNYPAAVHNDFHWLMKVACTWSDVKTLKQDMERNISTANAHFRIKLLQAAATLQTALGIQDIGQLHHQPLKDNQGTVVMTTVCEIQSAKAISPSMNFKWLPVAKLRRVSPSEDNNAGDLLVMNLHEQVNYGRQSGRPLDRGLYICYLKMKSSVDLLRVLVPKEQPNILPYCKVRHNPWVSSEEWQWIKKLSLRSEASNDQESDSCQMYPSTAQLLFQNQIVQAANKLLNRLRVDPHTTAHHRLHSSEVIELSSDVSLLLLLPPAESVCAVAGQDEAVFQQLEFLSIPVQVFEVLHLRTYQKDLMGRYSRLSCIVELETNLAQHAMREAFSSVELSEAKQRVARLQDLQTQIDTAWRSCRWIMDVLSFARDRTISTGVSMSVLTSQSCSTTDEIQSPQQTPKSTVLLRMKSENGINSHRSPTVETLLRTNFRSRTLACQKCSVPLDLPGYISSCESCALSRTRLNHTDHAELIKQQSKSDEALPLPSPREPETSSAASDSRRIVSRSENQLHSLAFHPFLDSEEADTTLFGMQPLSAETISKVESVAIPKLHRGGGHSGLGSSMRSNSQESECSRCSKQSKSSHTPSITSLSSAEGDPEAGVEVDASAAGIIQVYAAYESGLANGTSVKLHVTGKTTAREVVDLVVRQLNMAVVLKGKEGPVYGNEELKLFCLVTVIGARERCLRDDFRPLQLQNPWRKGRLFVRQKKDVLAAIEQNMRQVSAI